MRNLYERNMKALINAIDSIFPEIVAYNGDETAIG
jgi:hypothetical protein